MITIKLLSVPWRVICISDLHLRDIENKEIKLTKSMIYIASKALVDSSEVVIIYNNWHVFCFSKNFPISSFKLDRKMNIKSIYKKLAFYNKNHTESKFINII